MSGFGFWVTTQLFLLWTILNFYGFGGMTSSLTSMYRVGGSFGGIIWFVTETLKNMLVNASILFASLWLMGQIASLTFLPISSLKRQAGTWTSQSGALKGTHSTRDPTAELWLQHRSVLGPVANCCNQNERTVRAETPPKCTEDGVITYNVYCCANAAYLSIRQLS